MSACASRDYRRRPGRLPSCPAAGRHRLGAFRGLEELGVGRVLAELREVLLEERWQRVPQHKPLSIGVALLDLVPAAQHQPDLFAADNHRRQKLSPLIDRINDRYGRCSIGFGLFPADVRAFKGHAAFNRVPEKWEL